MKPKSQCDPRSKVFIPVLSGLRLARNLHGFIGNALKMSTRIIWSSYMTLTASRGDKYHLFRSIRASSDSDQAVWSHFVHQKSFVDNRPSPDFPSAWGGVVWIIWISPLRMAQFHHSLEPNCPQCSNYQVNSTSFHHEACLKSLYRKAKSNQSMDVAK